MGHVYIGVENQPRCESLKQSLRHRIVQRSRSNGRSNVDSFYPVIDQVGTAVVQMCHFRHFALAVKSCLSFTTFVTFARKIGSNYSGEGRIRSRKQTLGHLSCHERSTLHLVTFRNSQSGAAHYMRQYEGSDIWLSITVHQADVLTCKVYRSDIFRKSKWELVTHTIPRNVHNEACP